ncbi:MAG TPA: DUF1559 domain-containing protein [Gemmatales bacterium]|nr:DUF1559 domain-containing protein [Gemmatales bacterium]
MYRRHLLCLLLLLLVSPLLAQDDKATIAKNRNESAKNMRLMMLAMHNYHNDKNQLPAHASYDKSGKKPLLSWRVMILPYLNQNNLYKKFKFDEPWDSENNKILLKMMPKVYQMPDVKAEEGKTYYQVVTMPAKVPEGKTDQFRTVFSLAPTRLTLGQLTVQDGTSNTICILEANQPVEWTKPADMLWEHDAAPLPKFGIRPGDDFNVAFGDGSVRQIKKKIDDMDKHTRLMKQLIGRRDGMNEDVSPILK